MAIDRHNIKDKFRPEESLPEGFGWEDMEQGISDKMNKNNGNSFSFDKAYSYLLVLVFIGGITYNFLKNSKTDLAQERYIGRVQESRVQEWNKNLEDLDNRRQEGQETRGQEGIKKQEGQEGKIQDSKTQESRIERGQKTRLKESKKQEDQFLIASYESNKKINNAEDVINIAASKENGKAVEGNARKVTNEINDSSIVANREENQKEIEGNDTRGQGTGLQEEKKQEGKETREQESKIQESNKQEGQETRGQEGNKKQEEQENKRQEGTREQENKRQEARGQETRLEDSKKQEVAKTLENNQVMELQNISFLALVNQKSIQSQNINNINKENKVSFIQPQINRKSNSEVRNMIYLVGGVNQHFSLYGKDSIGDIKNQYERSRQAMSIGIGMERKLSKKLSLDAAINYHKIKSILDYDSVETRYNKVKQNVLISQTLNAITGDTIKTYATALVSGKKIRTVLHHNTETAIHVPIVFRYNWRIQKLSVGLGLGPSIHYTLSNDGRTVEAFDQFKTIDNNYLAKWSITGIGQLNLGYDVTNKISFGTKISTTLPLSNINKEVGTSLRRSMVIGQIYAGYRF